MDYVFDVMFLSNSVCQQGYSKHCVDFFMNFCSEIYVCYDLQRKLLDFGGNLDSFVDFGSLSRILYH